MIVRRGALRETHFGPWRRRVVRGAARDQGRIGSAGRACRDGRLRRPLEPGSRMDRGGLDEPTAVALRPGSDALWVTNRGNDSIAVIG